MAEHFILIAYDISDDRRRTKLHNALLNFGTPVQYSVFECLLDAKQAEAMRRAVKRIVRPRRDSVRFYTLCNACLGRVETIGPPEVLGRLPPSLIVG